MNNWIEFCLLPNFPSELIHFPTNKIRRILKQRIYKDITYSFSREESSGGDTPEDESQLEEDDIQIQNLQI